MDLHAWLAVGVTCGALLTLSLTKFAADAILFSAVAILVVAGVLTPGEAFSGFTNEGLITIAVLYVIARGMMDTGVVRMMAHALLGQPGSISLAQVRLMTPVAIASAFLNNTPVVAMLIPAVSDWAKRNNLDIGQLMIPLSYGAIIGGTCTLIGTSTNLIVNGMLIEYDPALGLSLFELAWVGIPAVIVVVIATLILSPWLLPKTGSSGGQFADARRYTVMMQVEEDSPLAGKSVEEAGLRRLPGMFLVEISRNEKIIPAVGPREILASNDLLLFAGVVESVVDLQKIRGLVPATNQVLKIDAPPDERSLVEVVVSNKNPNVGKSIRDGKFRSYYGAAIIAVARDGAQMNQKIGDIVLQAGDMLLLDTHRRFAEQQRYSQDFLLASAVENSEPVRYHRRFHAIVILLAMVTIVTLGWTTMLKASMVAAGLMLIFRCTSIGAARRSIDVEVLLVIASAIALGLALEKTGVVEIVAHQLVAASFGNVTLSLVTVFFLTAIITALVSNAAAAVILFPVIMASSAELGLNPLPLVVTLMVAASASFATPIGYQTNLMVYGPGGYHFNDFLRIGIPVTILVGIVVIIIAPLVWVP